MWLNCLGRVVFNLSSRTIDRCVDRNATHCAPVMLGMYIVYIMCLSLTLLAAVHLVIFHHELFELSQQLHRLLSDKEQSNAQNQ